MEPKVKKMDMGLNMRIEWEPERKRRIDVLASILQLSKIDFVKHCVDVFVARYKEEQENAAKN